MQRTLRGSALRLGVLSAVLAAVIGTVAWAQETPDADAPAADSPTKDIAARRPAARPLRIPERLDEYIIAGGPLMVPIGICSFVAIVFGLERLVVLRKRRVIPRDFMTRFIQHLEQGKLDRRAALKLCEENGSPVARVFEHAVRKWGKPSVEVEQAIIDGGERQVQQLRKHLRLLNAVSTIAPLLGLLGTVLGMIQTFYVIAASSGSAKASDFAGGIGIALITTAAGLFVAIPAMSVYLYFIGRVDLLVSEMDLAAQKVVNLISAEALASPSPPVASRGSSKPRADDEPEVREVKERRKVMG